MKVLVYLFQVFSFICFYTSCKSQPDYGHQYMQLIKTIPLKNVNGRIDHLAIDLKNQVVFISALGNNTVEVIDLKASKVVKSIAGLNEPQGIAFIPTTNELFVANGGNGECYFYDAKTFQKVKAVHLKSDADNVRYIASTNSLYVGYGNGGIAVINANTREQTANIKLPSHPEGFEVDSKNNLIYVNLPNSKMIGVVDLVTLKIVKTWERSFRSGNFPMALDSDKNKLFIGYRNDSKLSKIDTKTGHRINYVPMTNDSDNLFFDAELNRVYVSCGGGIVSRGFIDVFQMDESSSLKNVANL